jgi:hypothetical protein
MDISKIHASVQCLFSWTDTSTFSTRRHGSKPRTLATSNSSANGTLFSVNLTLSALTNSHRCGGPCERQKETQGALGGKLADVAIQCSLGDGGEAGDGGQREG